MLTMPSAATHTDAPRDRLYFALAEPSQKHFEILLAHSGNKGASILKGPQRTLQDKFQSHAIVAPANGLGVNRDRALRSLPLAAGLLQGHQNQSAGIPSFLGHHVQSRRTDIPDAVRRWIGAGPVISGHAGNHLPRSP